MVFFYPWLSKRCFCLQPTAFNFHSWIYDFLYCPNQSLKQAFIAHNFHFSSITSKLWCVFIPVNAYWVCVPMAKNNKKQSKIVKMYLFHHGPEILVGEKNFPLTFLFQDLMIADNLWSNSWLCKVFIN